MTDAINRAVDALYNNPVRRTMNIKYCYRDKTTGIQLADYRNRVAAQIESGVAELDSDLDRHLLD